MTRKVLNVLLALIGLGFAVYLALPGPSFPAPPPDSLQSKEPADSETPLRRAYFTNYTRQQVLDWYEAEFNTSPFKNIKLPTYLLNYPPENAQTIIRIQTRSTFLEEIVHPLRESIYINGFEPKELKDAINIEGKPWRQKIIVRHVPGSLALRLVAYLGMIVSVTVLFKEWSLTLRNIKRPKIKI